MTVEFLNPKVSLQLYDSGKIEVNGGKGATFQHLASCFELVYPELEWCDLASSRAPAEEGLTLEQLESTLLEP